LILTVKFHSLDVKESGSEILESRSRKFWKVGAGVGNFGKVGVGVGYFNSDSATLGRMQENQRNGQDDSDIVETSELFTITLDLH